MYTICLYDICIYCVSTAMWSFIRYVHSGGGWGGQQKSELSFFLGAYVLGFFLLGVFLLGAPVCFSWRVFIRGYCLVFFSVHPTRDCLVCDVSLITICVSGPRCKKYTNDLILMICLIMKERCLLKVIMHTTSTIGNSPIVETFGYTTCLLTKPIMVQEIMTYKEYTCVNNS